MHKHTLYIGTKLAQHGLCGVVGRSVCRAHFSTSSLSMKDMADSIQTIKATMVTTPNKIASMMRADRVNAYQVEELMDIAKSLHYDTKNVTDAYAHFYASRIDNHQLDRLESTQEHHLKVLEITTKLGTSSARMYAILIAAYALRGNAYRANVVLQAMREARVAPTREIYNLLIDVNGKEGNLEKCTKLFNDMQAFGWEPNAKAYNTLLLLNGRNGYIYACARLYDEMQTRGIGRFKSTYDVLLRIYGQRGLTKTCDKLLEEMKLAGATPDTHTYNLLLEAHRHKSTAEQCAALMESMRINGCEPDASTFTTLIRACEAKGQFTEGEAAYDHMRSVGVRPNMLTYRAVLACYAGMQAWDKCTELLAAMEAQGIEMDDHMQEKVGEVAQLMGGENVLKDLIWDLKAKKMEEELDLEESDEEYTEEVLRQELVDAFCRVLNSHKDD